MSTLLYIGGSVYSKSNNKYLSIDVRYELLKIRRVIVYLPMYTIGIPICIQYVYNRYTIGIHIVNNINKLYNETLLTMDIRIRAIVY